MAGLDHMVACRVSGRRVHCQQGRITSCSRARAFDNAQERLERIN